MFFFESYDLWTFKSKGGFWGVLTIELQVVTFEGLDLTISSLQIAQ